MNPNLSHLPPNMQPKEKRPGRALPVKYCGEVIANEWFRKFTFRERMAILFGFNFLVYNGIATQHRAGAFQPFFIGRVSWNGTPEAHLQEAVRNLIDSKNAETKERK